MTLEIMSSTIPLSLYVHIPWCIKKCPYCDFNSHVARQDIPESEYLAALCQDFEQQSSYIESRQIKTIFIGGGTPSLMSPTFYDTLLSQVQPYCASDVEITLEANPGTIDFSTSAGQSKFHGFRQAGINRLSLGIQSFSPAQLKYLGRMHSENDAKKALELAHEAGFTRINGDLMFGLTNQTIEEALTDIETLISFEPSHVSWYQLTIEPETHFAKRPPPLPTDDYRADMMQAGQSLLASHGFKQYEISAYTRDQRCRHNMNYWQFGDYIGIGAGAHGKITTQNPFTISRTLTPKHPKLYLAAKHKHQTMKVPSKDILFEAMLNLLRLMEPISWSLVESRTCLSSDTLIKRLNPLKKRELILMNQNKFSLTALGRRFVDDILEEFLVPNERPDEAI